MAPVMPMATFSTYAELLRPDHPMVKNYNRALTWRPSRYRSAGIDQAMRTEPGTALGDMLVPGGGAYETTTRLTARFRDDIREIAELAADGELLRVAELAEVPVSLEHLRGADPRARVIVGCRLDATAAESPRLRRRLALPADPGIMVHLDEVVFPGDPERSWGAMRFTRNRGRA